MRTMENVVDFADLCRFAEEEGIAFYNAAHDILYKSAYPAPESDSCEVYLSEIQDYPQLYDPKAAEILSKFMESEKVIFISVMKG